MKKALIFLTAVMLLCAARAFAITDMSSVYSNTKQLLGEMSGNQDCGGLSVLEDKKGENDEGPSAGTTKEYITGTLIKSKIDSPVIVTEINSKISYGMPQLFAKPIALTATNSVLYKPQYRKETHANDPDFKIEFFLNKDGGLDFKYEKTDIIPGLIFSIEPAYDKLWKYDERFNSFIINIDRLDRGMAFTSKIATSLVIKTLSDREVRPAGWGISYNDAVKKSNMKAPASFQYIIDTPKEHYKWECGHVGPTCRCMPDRGDSCALLNGKSTFYIPLDYKSTSEGFKKEAVSVTGKY